jgi:hypothetical protein
MTIRTHPGYAEKKLRLAEGGAVRNDGTDKHYKRARNAFGRFLSTKDRFTSGRKPTDWPAETMTDESWSK